MDGTTWHPKYVVDPTVPIRLRSLSMFVEGIRCDSCSDPLTAAAWKQWRVDASAPLLSGFYCPFCASALITVGRGIFSPWGDAP